MRAAPDEQPLHRETSPSRALAVLVQDIGNSLAPGFERIWDAMGDLEPNEQES